MTKLHDLSALETELLSSDHERRWSAAVALGKFVESNPDALWPIVQRNGSSDDEDIREAVATCILEHLLENHFDRTFDRLEEEIRGGNANLRDTLSLCWRFGQSKDPERAARWDRLVRGPTALR